MIDISFLQKLTLKKYLAFFESKISIYSAQRSKLSIMITSPMAEKEIASRKMFLQLEAFLKINGFAIKNEDLKKIVEHSKGNPILLVKNLFTYFRRRNEVFKLGTVVLQEILKIIGMNLKQRYGSILGFSSQDGEGQEIENFGTTTQVRLFLFRSFLNQTFSARPHFEPYFARSSLSTFLLSKQLGTFPCYTTNRYVNTSLNSI